MSRPKKSVYRIVPANHEKLGPCWSLKENDTVIGTFISKQHAEKRKVFLEAELAANFVIKKTANQELKVLED
jgi:tRNA A22 N-methylase